MYSLISIFLLAFTLKLKYAELLNLHSAMEILDY